VANIVKLFGHNVRYYWHFALSFDPGLWAVNYAKKSFMKLTPGGSTSPRYVLKIFYNEKAEKFNI
jgi:hypothetical protein